MVVCLWWLKKWLCVFSRLRLDWPQFGLTKNLPKREIVGYLYVGCTFAKTNIQVWCWTRCSNILTRFSVLCTCAVFYARFIYLRNPHLISCWPSYVLIRQNQMVYLFLKLCQQFRKLWMCLVCFVRCSYILGPSIFVADSCETDHRLFVDCSEAQQEVITGIAFSI